jgi:transcription termination factor Rho
VQRSRTRKEELLVPSEELERIHLLLRVLSSQELPEACEMLKEKLKKTKTNSEFLQSMQKM